MTGPRWIKQWINELALLNERFRDDDGKVDFDALGREEYQVRMALITHNFSKSNRAKETYSVANNAYKASVENGLKGGRPPKVQGDAGHREAPDVSATVSDNTAVDASTRKDEEDRKSGTSTANLSEAIAGMFPTSRNRREGSGSVLRGGCIENGPSRIPATAQQLYDLADRLSVDRDDARQCWEATKERHGKTKDGKEIKDFPAYMVKWCKTTEAKRKSA